MAFIFTILLIMAPVATYAIGCDCEIWVYSPMTGSHTMAPTKFKTFELEEFSTYSVKNQLQCRKLCHERYMEDMTSARLNVLLSIHGQNLISQGKLGYNCTGLTTLKFPVRVKAKLGPMGLGNVADTIQVINHEEICF